MKKLTILAALLMTTASAAHAGNSISLEIDGHRIRIEAPRNCDALSCLQISGSGLSGSGFKSRRFDDGDDAAASPDPSAPKSPPAPVVQAAAPPAPAVMTATPPGPAVQNDAAAAVPPAAATAVPATPVGIWSTEGNKGRVRVEACGNNLCGYADKTGEKILINMRPTNAKWTGQIHDPDSGRNYDSTITMKGPNALQVQGCAFGGLFCGGQTWSRIS